MMTDNLTDHNALHRVVLKTYLDLYRQSNQDSSNGRPQGTGVEVRGLNFSLEIWNSNINYY